MLRYHVAFFLPKTPGEMVVAEALDLPGAITQGSDLSDARLTPIPSATVDSPDAGLIELVPLSVHAGTTAR